jgi:hypothetical protein
MSTKNTIPMSVTNLLSVTCGEMKTQSRENINEINQRLLHSSALIYHSPQTSRREGLLNPVYDLIISVCIV